MRYMISSFLLALALAFPMAGAHAAALAMKAREEGELVVKSLQG